MDTTAPAPAEAAPAAHRSRREQVYVGLRAELMSGRISPFERLAEERLAEQFGVSRTPIREALARLQSDGLVEKRDGGLYLYVPSFPTLVGLYELRVTLELQGIRRAIEDPTVEHDRPRLEAELGGWYLLSEDRPTPSAGFVAVDERFHSTLLDSAGNPALTDALHQVNQRIRPVRMYDYLTENRMAATIAEHIAIAEHVLAGRLTTALDALRDHVGASKDVVMQRAANAVAMTRMAHLGQRSGS